MIVHVVVLACLPALALAGSQAIAVEGAVVCDGKPYADAKIKLYERDPVHDDELSRVYTKSDGKFYISGAQSEVGGIETHFNIYHKCGMSWYKKLLPFCYYKATFKVPDTYLSSGSVASKTYNAQTIELSMHQTNYDCIN